MHVRPNDTPCAPVERGLARRGCRSFFKRLAPAGALCCFLLLCPRVHADPRPIQLHPQNPHYFLWRGKPAILISSGEHYGAVINLDFDYRKYLETLARDHLNLTRTFLAYREQPGAFNIAGNSLAPKPDKFIAPWARSPAPGYFDGGNKFDLTQWDAAYFSRLKDFVRFAAARGIVVEANLFSCFYSEKSWNTHPLNSRNNINGVGNCAWDEALGLKHGDLLKFEEAYVRKVIEELREFDNVYYEICNEPYIGGVDMNWHAHMADLLAQAQQQERRPKLISWNVANNRARIDNPHPAISIFNFHYASPPITLAENFRLNRVLGDNETGFRGINNAPYRIEGWAFILSGGGLYNNLDYSFTAGHEDGSYVYPQAQPGGGNALLRRQLRILGDFIRGFDFVKMAPDAGVIKTALTTNLTAHVLAQPGKAWAIYFRPANVKTQTVAVLGSVEVDLAAGRYRADWVSPLTGETVKSVRFHHRAGGQTLEAPRFAEDIALRIKKE